MTDPREQPEPIPESDRSRQLDVESAEAGWRVDRFLSVQLPASRRRVRDLLAAGAVTLDGSRVGLAEKGRALGEGSQLHVAEVALRAADQVLPQSDLVLPLIGEGRGWIAVDKPAGMAVHPLRGGETGTVLNAAVARIAGIQGLGEGGLRSGVVHRLDVETSGVLLIATDAARWEELRRAFREHRVEKWYHALVHGKFDWPPGKRLEVGLRVGRHRPARVRVSDEPAAEREGPNVWRASQSLRVLEQFDSATLVEIRPETGFLHQIRATLDFLGYPVLGDSIYGPPESQSRADRHMLHALRADAGEVSAEAAYPQDFAAQLVALRASDASASG